MMQDFGGLIMPNPQSPFVPETGESINDLKGAQNMDNKLFQYVKKLVSIESTAYITHGQMDRVIALLRRWTYRKLYFVAADGRPGYYFQIEQGGQCFYVRKSVNYEAKISLVSGFPSDTIEDPVVQDNPDTMSVPFKQKSLKEVETKLEELEEMRIVNVHSPDVADMVELEIEKLQKSITTMKEELKKKEEENSK